MPNTTGLITYVIVPCFNEEFRLNIHYWNELISSLDYNWIFVNDGSTDQTKKKLDQIKGIKILELTQNSGKAEAIRAGVNYAMEYEPREDLVISYLDSDSAFQIKDIKRIFNVFRDKLNKYEIESVWASRVALAGRGIFRSTTRHHLSRIIITFIGFSDKKLPYDPQTGFKIFYLSPNVKQIFNERFRTRWFFDIEIIRRWENINGSRLKIWEEPVDYWREMSGSKVNKFQYFRILTELLYILSLSSKK
jgi:dolichyl-phosphate beta-glucosyltransferase